MKSYIWKTRNHTSTKIGFAQWKTILHEMNRCLAILLDRVDPDKNSQNRMIDCKSDKKVTFFFLRSKKSPNKRKTKKIIHVNLKGLSK